ncbi:hypothetical protein, partial [Salmonella sp. s51228]|uniref:hypothetical protein n=1 Tax=Salmonella sp. s51228 TaxID=3159652 RepID=UPI00397F2C64
MMKAKESLNTIYKNNTNSQVYRDQIRLINTQVEKLSEGIDKLISFRWNLDTEEKLQQLGELDLVVYDYLSKIKPVIYTGYAGHAPGHLN